MLNKITKCFMKVVFIFLLVMPVAYADRSCVFKDPIVKVTKTDGQYLIVVRPQTSGICYTAILPIRHGITLWPQQPFQYQYIKDPINGIIYSSIIQGQYIAYFSGIVTLEFLDKEYQTIQRYYDIELK